MSKQTGFWKYGLRYRLKHGNGETTRDGHLYEWAEPIPSASGTFTGDVWLVDKEGHRHPGYQTTFPMSFDRVDQKKNPVEVEKMDEPSVYTNAKQDVEVCLTLTLRTDTPQGISDVLCYMHYGHPLPGHERPPAPDHPFFQTQENWYWFLHNKVRSFPASFKSDLIYDDQGRFALSVYFSCNNKDHAVELFLAWLSPYLDGQPGTFLGYVRFNGNETPRLVYYGEPQVLQTVLLRREDTSNETCVIVPYKALGVDRA